MYEKWKRGRCSDLEREKGTDLELELDKRIADIMKKIEQLSAKSFKFTCGEFPPKWKAPISEKEAAEFEREKGVKLPADYRRFITTTASAGTQPFYGLYGLLEPKPGYEFNPIVEKTFPYTLHNPLLIADLTDEEYNALYAEGAEESYIWGFILLCHEGCGMESILVLNTEDEETYGTVWFYDLSNDFGIAPLLSPKNGKPMHFLDWLEYWVDRKMGMEEDDWFSFMEIVGVPDG